MKRLHDLSYLCIRVLAIALFFSGMHHLANLLEFSIPSYLQIIDYLSIFEAFLMVGLPACFLILLSIIMWFSARRLSGYLLPKGAIIRMIMTYVLIPTEQGFAISNRIQLYSIAEQGFRFIIGTVLLVKAEGFAHILRKIRKLGLKEQQ